jgi:hypothetical protein
MKKIFLAAVLTGAMAASALAEYQIDFLPEGLPAGAAPTAVTMMTSAGSFVSTQITGPSGAPPAYHAVWQGDGVIPNFTVVLGFNLGVACDTGAEGTGMAGAPTCTPPIYLPGPAAPPACPQDFDFMGFECDGDVAVQLTAFAATGDRAVELTWSVEGSDYAAFNLKRNGEDVYTGTAFSYTDNVFSGDYTYTLEVQNLDGSVSVLGSLDHVVRYFELGNAYPNPFNPTTTISYDLANDTMVNLSVFNLAGQKVTTLVNDARAAGHYEMTFDASALSSGVYFYRIEAGSFTAVNKFTLVK